VWPPPVLSPPVQPQPAGPLQELPQPVLP